MGGKHQVNAALRSLLLADHGEDALGTFEAGYSAIRPVTLRINSLKITAEEGKNALLKAGFSFEEVPWYSDALILKDVREEDLWHTELYTEGKIYLQSLSSMLPPLYLKPSEKESVLDMTAAPGGKTTELLALSDGKALITACERDKNRFQRLKFNLGRQGAGRVTAICTDTLLLDDAFAFDKILLDAPCSGSGTVTEGREARIDAAFVEKCAVLQEKLLKKALRLLKKGGELVYSTCSVLKRENEEVVKRGICSCRSRLEPVTPFEGIPHLPSMEGTLCIPPTDLFEGFFLAKIVKE